LYVHRLVHYVLDNCPLRRVEAYVDFEFEPGHRWARMLGFKLEAPRMKCHRPDGGDSALYARIR